MSCTLNCRMWSSCFMRMACTPWARRSSCRTCTSCWRLQPQARHPQAAAVCRRDPTELGAQGCLSLGNVSCAWPAFHGRSAAPAEPVQAAGGCSLEAQAPPTSSSSSVRAGSYQTESTGLLSLQNMRPQESMWGAAVCCEFEHSHAVAQHVVYLEHIALAWWFPGWSTL